MKHLYIFFNLSLIFLSINSAIIVNHPRTSLAMPAPSECLNNFLFQSIRRGKYDEAKSWICLGADVNARDKEGNTPLIQAAWEGHLIITKLLLNNGADIDATNNYGQTALMIAVLGVRRCVIQELLCKGANINIQAMCGNSAAMVATFIRTIKPSIDVMCMLLNYMPNLKLKNKNRDTLLTLAVMTDRYYLVKNILCHMNERLTFEERNKILNQRNLNGDTSFMLATQKFNNQIACFLLQQGADVDRENFFGNTPLMIAILQRNLRLMYMLLNCDVNINHQNRWGYTPLMFSVINDHVKMTKALLKCNADLCLKNDKNNNVIDIAKYYRYFDAARMLECKLKKRNLC